jgi:predicted DNA-binding protein YlxM (UPF0122 family)
MTELKTLKDIEFRVGKKEPHDSLHREIADKESIIYGNDLRQAAREWIKKLERQIKRYENKTKKFRKIDQEHNDKIRDEIMRTGTSNGVYRQHDAAPTFDEEIYALKIRINDFKQFFNLEEE